MANASLVEKALKALIRVISVFVSHAKVAFINQAKMHLSVCLAQQAVGAALRASMEPGWTPHRSARVRHLARAVQQVELDQMERNVICVSRASSQLHFTILYVRNASLEGILSTKDPSRVLIVQKASILKLQVVQKVVTTVKQENIRTNLHQQPVRHVLLEPLLHRRAVFSASHVENRHLPRVELHCVLHVLLDSS